MEKSKILEIMREIEQIYSKYGVNNTILAFYIYTRLGDIEELTNEDIEQIDNILNKADTIFGDYINIEVEEMLNNKED